MDAPQFDALSKTLSTGETRRKVLGALAAAPALGGLVALFARDEAEARKRRAGRKHDGHGVDAEKKRKKKKKKKKKCQPEPAATTCAGKCGTVTNNCKQSVSCTPCACKPSCAGKCDGGRDGCGGTCSGGCSANQICDGGVCHACDVCADGCTYDSVRNAARQASAGDTLYICPGIYNRPEDGGEVASFEVNMTVVGAGSAEGGTILDGEGEASNFVLVEINDATVTLRSLAIQGGNRQGDVAGGLRIRSSTVTLDDVTVIDNNSSVAGGGIVVEDTSTLTLKNTTVRDNTAPNGAGILNEGTVIFESGNDVSGNTTGNCVNNGTGTGCPA